MVVRSLLLLAALTLAACDRAAAPAGESAQAPELEAPAPDSEPSRPFAPANDAAREASGALNVEMALRMPDAGEASQGAAPLETLTLRGENNLLVEAEIQGAVTPATQVSGQTLRALLSLPVEEARTLVYRVVTETKPESGRGLCGEAATAYVVLWEPDGPGESVLKLLGVSGAAPGADGARPCTLLEYNRQ